MVYMITTGTNKVISVSSNLEFGFLGNQQMLNVLFANQQLTKYRKIDSSDQKRSISNTPSRTFSVLLDPMARAILFRGRQESHRNGSEGMTANANGINHRQADSMFHLSCRHVQQMSVPCWSSKDICFDSDQLSRRSFKSMIYKANALLFVDGQRTNIIGYVLLLSAKIHR